MSRPRHRRCDTCGAVTARYSHTQNAGAFTVRIWNRSDAGERLLRNGTQVFCTAHAPARDAS